MLDSDQIIVLISFALMGVYMWINWLLDNREAEAFHRGYERGIADGRLIRAKSQ